VLLQQVEDLPGGQRLLGVGLLEDRPDALELTPA